MTKHSFADVAETLIAALIKAADDNLTEAQNLKQSVIVLTEGITEQVAEHTRLLNDMDSRLRTFGESVLTAHKTYINGQAHENPSP
jgi:hypothetical protein